MSFRDNLQHLRATRNMTQEPSIPSGPVTDVCGYDERTRSFASRISVGSALCVLSTVPAVLLGGSASVSLGALGISNASAVGMLLMFALIAAGCALLIPAGLSHAAFTREHPYIEDFYTTEDRNKAQALLSTCITSSSC